MDFESLKDPEIQEKLRTCKTADELVALAKEEGLELTDEQLEAVAGGESIWDAAVGCDGQACVGHGCGEWTAPPGSGR